MNSYDVHFKRTKFQKIWGFFDLQIIQIN